MSGQTTIGGWTIHLQSAIQGDPQGYDAPASKYDDPNSTYDTMATSGQWVTIDCQLLSVVADRGGSLERIPGVRASVGRLRARLYDPDRILDPAASPFAALTRPGAPLRLIAQQGGTIRPLWTGFTDTWSHDLLTGEGDLEGYDVVTALTGVDLSEWERPQEASRSRYAAALVLTPITVPFIWEGASVTVAEAKMSGDLWSSTVVPTAEAEQSIVWIDAGGNLHRRPTNILPPLKLALDCDDGTAPIIYTRLSSEVNDDLLVNMIQVERVNYRPPDKQDRRLPLSYSSRDSALTYGPRTLTNTRLVLVDDASLKEWANKVLERRATPKTQATGMEIMVANLMPWANRGATALTQIEVGDLLDIRLTSRGEAERWVGAVASLQHSITPNDWAVTLELADGPPVAENAGYDALSSIYDTSKYARVPGVGPAQQQEAFA